MVKLSFMRLLAIIILLSPFVLKAQNNQKVSMNGMGDIKLGMTHLELEKLTGSQVKLVRLLKKDGWERDTLEINHKGISFQVIMDRDYINEKSSGFIIYEIRSNSDLLKTTSGIGIGDDKIRIINTYQDFMIQVMPSYEDDYKTKSKTRSTVWLHGENGKLIVFYLINNKVNAFSVMYDEGC